MQTAVYEKQLIWVPVSNLLFDNENPRLPPSAKRWSQNEILKIYERDFDLLPIAQSMADNGYFVEEPLIVIPKPKDTFIVIEGNRRLAALKLLTNPELRRITRDRKIWENLAKRARALGHDLIEAPVIVHSSRDELTAILGFRHITGILKWDPLSKARFINLLIEQKGEKADFAELAREIGSRRHTVRDNYVAYRLYIQARDQFDIDTRNLEKNFGVFYRALSSAPILDFIRLKKEKSPVKLRSPISKRKANALKELIEYIHGTANVGPVLTDSRQLTMLGEVLASPEALDSLRVHRHLKLAYALTGGEERSLVENLQRADFLLGETLKDVYKHKQSTKVVHWVERCAGRMFEILKYFPEVEKRLREVKKRPREV